MSSKSTRTHVLATLVVTALLLTAGCAGVLGSASPDDADPDAASQSDVSTDGRTADDRSITVGASGQAETDPDQAIVHVSVLTRANDAATARQQLADNVSAMRNALTDAGIDESQITTVRYDIDRDRRHRPPERGDDAPEEPTYRAVHRFRITLSDLDKTGVAIDAAVDSGATEVDGVDFTLSAEKRNQLRQEALRDAMANARTEAETVADPAGLELTGVHSVATADVRVRPRYEHATAAAGDAGTSIDTGSVTVRAQVEVTFNATDAS